MISKEKIIGSLKWDIDYFLNEIFFNKYEGFRFKPLVRLYFLRWVCRIFNEAYRIQEPICNTSTFEKICIINHSLLSTKTLERYLNSNDFHIKFGDLLKAFHCEKDTIFCNYAYTIAKKLYNTRILDLNDILVDFKDLLKFMSYEYDVIVSYYASYIGKRKREAKKYLDENGCSGLWEILSEFYPYREIIINNLDEIFFYTPTSTNCLEQLMQFACK